MKFRYAMAAVIALSTLAAQARSARFTIIPEPVQIEVAEADSFRIDRGMPVVVSSPDLMLTAKYLADYMDKYLGIPVSVSSDEDGFGAGVRMANLGNGGISGGYSLTVTPEKGVLIEGNDAAGVFYGMQTLIQLLPLRAGVIPLLPAVHIVDYPRFAYRGMHLDVVRHFFPVEFVKRYIDMLARHKLNYFHWHLTDDQAWRIEMKSHPELTAQGSEREGEIEGLYPGKYRALPYGGYYTQEQVREVVEYAAERHITVIPEIDIPGHCMAVLAVHPEFSTTPDEPKSCAKTWGIFNKFNNVLAPRPEVFAFLKDVFSELCDIFPGQYIHVGGDECAKRWWQESEDAQKFMRDNGLKDEKALQSHFIHYVQSVVNSKGKTLVGWDEVLEGGISEDCIIMNWRKPTYGAKAVKTGHRTILTSSGWSYFNMKESRNQTEIGPRGPLPLEKVYGYQAIPDSITDSQKELIWGVQGCLWTEYVPTTWKAEFSVFPRMSALAENAWSAEESKDWDNFVRKVEAQIERYELWGVRYSDAFFRTQDIERKR